MTPITCAILLSVGGYPAPSDRTAALADSMNQRFAAWGLTTPLRQAHFLAQTAHETGGFRWLEELGKAAYFAQYDGRADLGNTEPGDGLRFKGRGLIQITGRANYAAYGKQLGLDLLDHPDIAAEPDNAVQIACAFWSGHGLNELADADVLKPITLRINGGVNGILDRSICLVRAKRALGLI